MSGYYQSPFLEQDLPTAFSTRPIPSPFNPSASRQDSALDAPGADVEPAQKSKTVSKKRRPSGNSQSDVSYHHYFFKHDADHFLHVHLIEEALLFDPLLYAVVGFAAFQYRVKHGHGDSLEFLEYYNKSVSTLRQSLASGEPHKDGTMLTVLQLATFEEYMGDFVSLLSHQQAAFRMLLELYNTDSILESELRRKVLEWYLKFDITSSIMSGNETAASRGWFSSIADYYRGLTSQCPENIDYKIETAIGDHRLTCVDMTTMFARFSKGEITPEDFKIKCESFSQELNRWRDKLDPVFSDDRYRMWIFSNRSREENDIVDPFMAGGLYKGPLATFNFMTADWIAILAMFKYKKALLLGETLPPELPELALELCRIFEAIEYSPELPPEAVLKAQGILGVASLFLPKDERHTMWCRRKLAKIEALGYASSDSDCLFILYSEDRLR
ncbi:uncharacterized protein KY384_003234 [Bacidia gigantensis]|uniref:uncharacterized protein n=1 Tax=Bacidia gigantensis TaxID=2732470 RepID=UPI001D03F353|nr:uncharacterized protein KY384_003234 [Bacidia gigantensis]KAG8531604.1 hypothetical protein KY384_003234 [Bacidia gigantensis]